MKGLYSGRQIKDLKGRSQKITRSQTASSAYAAIMGKYGSIQDNAHYYHLGKSVWHKYSLENDRKRTGKLAESKAVWAERPNKFDWVGIDTKQGLSKGSSKGPSKGPSKKFSVSSLKSPAPTGRKGKAAPKFAGKPVTKAIKLHDENAVMAEIRRLQRENASLQAKINAVGDFDKRHDGRHKPFVAKQEDNNKEIKRLKNRYDFLTDQGEFAPRKPKAKKIDPPMDKWNFVDQSHPLAMYISSGVIKNSDKYTKADRIKWLSMEISRIKSLLKGERAEKVTGMYNVNWANKNAQAMKMQKIRPLMDQKSEFEKALRLEKGLTPTPIKTNKPHVQYFHFKTGESANNKKNSDYWKITDELYPKYYTAQNGNKFYEGWVNKGEMHYSGNKTPSPVKTPASVSQKMPKLSLSSMKAPSKPSGRKTPLTGELNGIKVNSLQRARKIIKVGYYFREGFTWKNNSTTFKIVSITGTGNNKNIKYVNVAKPDKKYVTSEKDLTFDMQMNKEIRKSNIEMAEREAEYKKKEAEHQKKLDAEYQKQLEGLEGFETTIPALRRTKVIEVLNRFIRNDGKIKSSKDIIREKIKAGWVVEKHTWSTDRKIRGERVGTEHTKKVLAKGDESLAYVNKTDTDFAEYLIKKWGISTPKLSTSMLKAPSKLSSRTNKVAPRGSQKVVTKTIAVQGKYRYASFMRPLGTWFNPGTPFKIETVTASDRDFRYNRAPHSVISTGSRLSEETLKKFELVDLAEGKKLQELIKYARSFNFLSDSMKGQLEDLILKGKGKAEIDKYIEKGRKMSEKKTQKPSSSSVRKTPDEARRDKLQEINTKIAEMQKSIAFSESKGVRAISEIQACNRLIKTRDRLLGIAPVKVSKSGQYVEKSARDIAIEDAHTDWDNQAKAKLMYNREWRDKSLKACVERHLRSVELQA